MNILIIPQIVHELMVLFMLKHELSCQFIIQSLKKPAFIEKSGLFQALNCNFGRVIGAVSLPNLRFLCRRV